MGTIIIQNRVVRAIVCDVDRLARFDLTAMLELADGVQVVGEADTVVDANNLLVGKQPDIAFLDIRIAQSIGFNQLTALNFDGPLIFLTTPVAPCATESLSIAADGFLLKPVESEPLKAALDKAWDLKQNLESEISGDDVPGKCCSTCSRKSSVARASLPVPRASFGSPAYGDGDARCARCAHRKKQSEIRVVQCLRLQFMTQIKHLDSFISFSMQINRVRLTQSSLQRQMFTSLLCSEEVSKMCFYNPSLRL